MRIAFVSFEYPPGHGGAKTYAVGMTEHMAARGHEVHAFVPDVPGVARGATPSGVHVHPLRVLRAPYAMAPSYWVSAARALGAQEGFDVVHSHTLSDLLLRKRGGRSPPRVFTAHHSAKATVEYARPGLWKRVRHVEHDVGASSLLEGVCIRRADLLHVPSESVRRELRRHHGVPEDRVVVIPNGVHAPARPSSDLAKATRAARMEEGRPHALFAGRLELRKGLDVLLRALALAPPAARPRLLVAGPGDAGALVRQARDLGLERDVAFLGPLPREELDALLWLTDFFVFPSRQEGFGLAAAEAMMAGRPVVATRAGALPEVVAEGTGLLVEVDDAAALAQAIALMTTDEAMRRRMGEAAARHAVRWTWAAHAESLEAAYLRLLNRA